MLSSPKQINQLSSDPFLTEVVRNGLASIAEEMTLIVTRAAGSPVLREAGDLSSAITDADGNIIAQGRDLPVHLGVMAFTVKALIKAVGEDQLTDGDIWITNHPEVGGNHLPDVKIIRPIFRNGQRIAFAISLAHWADVGGGAPGSYNASATDVWQEGLIIPPVRLMRNDTVNAEMMSFILANLRGAHEGEADILAQISSCTTAGRRMQELIDRTSWPAFRDACTSIQVLSERQTRDLLRIIPNGRYYGEDFIDGDGRGGAPVKVAVCLTVEDDRAVFDFSASANAIRAPLNTTPFATQAALIYALKALSPHEIYHAAGVFVPLTVVTRRGSILDPGPGFPLAAGNHETTQRVVDAIMRALSSALPSDIPAGGCGSAGLLIFAGQRNDGRRWTFYETHGGGEGAQKSRQGCDATRIHLSNMANTPCEVIETEYPIKVRRYAIRDGSGGRGAQRGGHGLIREYEVLDDQVTLTTIFERGVIAPFGLFGGEDGKQFAVTLLRNQSRIKLTGCQNRPLTKGDIVLVETAGGGGYGPFIQ